MIQSFRLDYEAITDGAVTMKSSLIVGTGTPIAYFAMHPRYVSH